MRGITFAERARMDHPPLMLPRLLEAMRLSKPWRDAMSLSEHLCRRAVKEEYISTSAEDRAILGLPTLSSRQLRQANKRVANASSSPSGSGKPATTTAKTMIANAITPVGDSQNSAIMTIGDTIATRKKRLVSFDVLDCTLGGGHHSAALLEAGDPMTRVVALDTDPDTLEVANHLKEGFTGSRFKFFNARMSSALPMFGECTFDLVVVDPGPNATQLFDPTRGFVLDDGNNSSLDLRYSNNSRGTTGLQWLNSEQTTVGATALAATGLVKFSEAHRMLATLQQHRPLQGSLEVIGILEQAGGALPEDVWVSTMPQRSLPPSMRFLMALRAVINDEAAELRQALQQSTLLLRPEGQVVMFTRYKWESDIMNSVFQDHPYILPVYSEVIESSDVEEYGFPRTTKMNVFRRSQEVASTIRNDAVGVSAEQRQMSALHHMLSLDTSADPRYPADNFTFHRPDRREKRILRENAAAPPLVDQEKSRKPRAK